VLIIARTKSGNKKGRNFMNPVFIRGEVNDIPLNIKIGCINKQGLLGPSSDVFKSLSRLLLIVLRPHNKPGCYQVVAFMPRFVFYVKLIVKRIC